jgi:shikimate kinase
VSAATVYLIGLPACGKTTLGQALPRQMAKDGLVPARFIDLDEAIENDERASVAEIFAAKGETYFRRAESAMLRRLTAEAASATAPLVIACGGGTPCHDGNIDYMLANGLVVELRTDRATTLRRLLEAPPGQRPLVAKAHGRPEALDAELDALEGRRSPVYSLAHAVFDSTRLETAHEVEASAAEFIGRFLKQA